MPFDLKIEDLVPHEHPMLLLDALVDYGSDYIVCRLVPRQDGLFNVDNVVPAVVGLEYMAQSIAALSGIQALEDNRPPKIGFLLGTRKFDTNVASFECDIELKATAIQAVRGSQGMAAFHCTVEGPEVHQTATIAVYEPSDIDKFLLRDDY
jgi:predicted hotdog family 3-hydroxylacyl-ACP dehydratase